MSRGVVTLRFSGEASTSRTVPPARSTSEASSVAAASVSGGASRARRRASARNTWGVCTAHSRVRSSVRSTRAVLGLLDRVGHGSGRDRPLELPERARCSAPRAHGSRAAAPRRAPRPRSPLGRRPGRCAPTRSGVRPPTHAVGRPLEAGGHGHDHALADRRRNASRLHSSIGLPARTANALGPVAPRRSPLPPAGMIPTTDNGLSATRRRARRSCSCGRP